MTYSGPLRAIMPMQVSTITMHPWLTLALCDNTSASAVWPTADLAMYIPFALHAPAIVKELWWYNGASVSGTVDAAVYNEDGTQRLFSAGAPSQAGTSAPQAVDITDTLLLPGRYWMGLVLGNTTGTFVRLTGVTNIPAAQKFFGMQQQALGSTAMPSSTTFAAASNNYIPIMGLNLETAGP